MIPGTLRREDGGGGGFHAPLPEEGTIGPSNTSKLGNLEMPDRNVKLNDFGVRRQERKGEAPGTF